MEADNEPEPVEEEEPPQVDAASSSVCLRRVEQLRAEQARQLQALRKQQVDTQEVENHS